MSKSNVITSDRAAPDTGTPARKEEPARRQKTSDTTKKIYLTAEAQAEVARTDSAALPRTGPGKGLPKRAAHAAAKAALKSPVVGSRIKPALDQSSNIIAKGSTMVTQSSDFTAQVKATAAKLQDKAKAAIQDASTVVGELNGFAKGNTDAIVEAGKNLRAGLNGLVADYVADSRTSLELLKADAKQLATIGSPGELLKFQANILGRNILLAMNGVSKNNDAVLGLAREAATPIAARIALTATSLQNLA